MRLPQRPKEHILESISWKILQQNLPDEWILRDIAGRDYGIDCYIELVDKNNQLTGDLVSIQLKGRTNLKWQKDSKGLHNISTISGIKTSTINYWMSLPVPSFLFIAEIDTRKIYYVSIKQYIRRNYSKTIHQKSMSFAINDIFEISASHGLQLFLSSYFMEKTRSLFSYNLITLLYNAKNYADFIDLNYGRDFFLGVESDVELQLLQMYITCNNIANFLMIDWDVIPLSEAYNQDKETFSDSFYRLHELTLSKVLIQILKILPQLIQTTKDIVLKKERDYWMKEHYLIYNFCERTDLDLITRELKESYEYLTRRIENIDDLWK